MPVMSILLKLAYTNLSFKNTDALKRRIRPGVFFPMGFQRPFLNLPEFPPTVKQLHQNYSLLFRHAQDFFRRVRAFAQVPRGAYFEVREHGFCVKVRAMRKKDKHV
jgi:hypothetical protein